MIRQTPTSSTSPRRARAAASCSSRSACATSCCCPTPTKTPRRWKRLPGELPAAYVQRVTRAKLRRRARSAWRAAACRRRRSCAPTPPWRWAGASSASRPMPPTRRACCARCRAARTACSPRWRVHDGRRERLRGRASRACASRAMPRREIERLRRQRRALRQGRRLRDPERASRPGSSASTAATPASWACRCSRRRSCCSAGAALLTGVVTPQPRAQRPMQDILINWAPQETRVAVVENGAVQELHVERALERGLVGNIYPGKVARVLPGMQSAFIDIGLERAAFLHVADVHVATAQPAAQRRTRGDAAPPTPIERQVFEGQTLTVQVIKDPIGTKGARLSTQISIAGRLLVFLPQDDHIGISQKIGSPELREQLRARMSALASAARRRRRRRRLHPAHQRRRGERRRTGRRHRLPAQDLGARCASARFKSPPGTLLHQDLSLVERVLRDLAHDSTQTIRIDSRMQFEQLQGLRRATSRRPRWPSCEHYKGERPIFDLFNIDEEIATRAGAAGRPEVGRLPDHRPDRGADHGRREHRRLRRRAQLRRHDLQDQPRGGAGDRAPAAPAQPRRHHHRRLHRHDARGAPGRGARRVAQAARARPHQDHGERLHAARAWWR